MSLTVNGSEGVTRRGVLKYGVAATAAGLSWRAGLAPAAGRPATGPAVPAGAEAFEQVHALVKPHAGESRWMDVPWLTSVWAARQQAAAEGKPIFIWAGSGGGPVGVC